MNILKKISVKTVCNKPKSFFRELKAETPMMRVFAVARGTEDVPTDYGNSVKFKGEFKAIDLETGEVSMSAVAYFPNPIDLLIKAKIDELGNDGTTPVEFALDIHVVPDDNSSVGYVYRTKLLTEAKASAPLEALAARFSDIPLLAAPKQAGGQEPEVLAASSEGEAGQPEGGGPVGAGDQPETEKTSTGKAKKK